MNYHEEMDAEWNAQFDDIRERYAGELRPCRICGAATIDPVACLELHEPYPTEER
jgi:hypothetical protein